MLIRNLFSNPFPTFGQTFFSEPGDGAGAGQGTASGQTGTGTNPDGVNDVIADMDMSVIKDLPEEKQKVILTEWTKKAKNLQSIGSKKVNEKLKELEMSQQRLSSWNNVITKFEADPKLQEVIKQTITDYNSGKMTPKQVESKATRKLDQLLETTTDPEVREQLRQTRQIIREEANLEPLKQKINDLEGELARIRSTTFTVAEDRVNSAISDLSSKFGAELVGKYENDIRQSLIKNIKLDPERTFFFLATPNDTRTAIANESKKAKETSKRKPGIDPSASPSVVTISEHTRDKGGRVEAKSIVRRVLERHRGS